MAKSAKVISRIQDQEKFQHHTEMATVRSILIDPVVQRAIIPARERELTERLNLDALGVISVSRRKDGKLYCIDGQHRLAALRNNDFGDWEVTCHVYEELSKINEANLWRWLNNHRVGSPWEKYDKGLKGEDPHCLEVDRIVRANGLTVGTSSRDGVIACVATLLAIVRQKPDSLDWALLIATSSWGKIAAAVENDIVKGLAIVEHTYGEEIDTAPLISKLSTFSGGPSALLGKARGLKEIKSASVARLVAGVVVQVYNKGRRTRLADL